MKLLLPRLIVAALIAASNLISYPCSNGQENQPYEVAVLDVQKVMDSIEDLPADDAKAQLDAYRKIQRATGVLAKAKGIKFVLRVDTANLEDKTLLDLQRMDDADMNPVVYRTRMDLTDPVIEAIQSDDDLERIAKVSDSGGIGVGPLNGSGRTIIGPLSLGRGNTQSWALVPITDSSKLQRMQLLYQEAIASGLVSKTTRRRNARSECALTGSHCRSNVIVCCERRAEFTKLTLNVLDAALGSPVPAATPPQPEPTVKVKEFIYDESGTRIEKVHEYTAKRKDIDNLPENSLPEKVLGDAREGTIVAPFSTDSVINVERSQLESLRLEQQRQIQRGILFPPL